MPKSILVVDDAEQSLRELTAALERSGYAPMVLVAADDPVARITVDGPELVFLSLQTPEAVALCEGIRDKPDGAIVPIIFVGTGSEEVRSPSDALTRGGDYYFALPLNMAKVLAKVQTYVGPGGAPAEPDLPPPSRRAVPRPGFAPVATSIELPPDLDPEKAGAGGELDAPRRATSARRRGDDLPELPDLDWSTPHAGKRGELSSASDSLLSEIRASEAAAATHRDRAGTKLDREPRRRERAEVLAEQARRGAAEQARPDAGEKARRGAAEQARRDAAEQARRGAAEQARRDAAEQARRTAEEISGGAAYQSDGGARDDSAERGARSDGEPKSTREDPAGPGASGKGPRLRRVSAAVRRTLGLPPLAPKRPAGSAAPGLSEIMAELPEPETDGAAIESALSEETLFGPTDVAAGDPAHTAADSTPRGGPERARPRRQGSPTAAELLAAAERGAPARVRPPREGSPTAADLVAASARPERGVDDGARARAHAEGPAPLAGTEQLPAAEPVERAGHGARPVAITQPPAAGRGAAGKRERARTREALAGDPRVTATELPAAGQAAPEWAPAPRAPGAGPGPLCPLQPEEGSFSATHDIAGVLHEMWKQQVTGRVDFVCETHRKSIFFERGGPVDAYSSQVFDRMEEYLYRTGKITRAQHQDLRVKGLRNPRQICAYLVSEGFLKPEELFAAVRGHLEEVVLGLFEWEEGTYQYLPEHAEEDDRIILDMEPRALILEGVRRKYLMPRLAGRLGSPSSLLAKRTDAAIEAEALGLDPEERRVVRLLDGSRTIEDLVFSTGLSGLRVYQVLAALLALELVEMRVRGIEGVDADGASAGDAIDRQRIAEKLEQIRRLDYFQVLGVPPTATPYELDRACERALREFASERFSEPVRRELGEQLEEITQVFEDARYVLRNDALREAYARHIP